MTAITSESGDVRFDIEEAGAVVRVLRVEVAVTRVDSAFERAYREAGRGARIPGFRPGKAPRSVLERVYGSSIGEQVQRALVGESLADAVELAGIVAVSEPDVESEAPKAGAAFSYTARIEIKPSIELPEIEGLPAARPAVTDIRDEEIDAELENLRQRRTPLVEEPEGTPAAKGHVLNVDFVGRIGGAAFEGGSAKDASVEIGAGRMIPGFEEQLIGATEGSDVEVSVTFPDDYAVEGLRGKSAVFAVHVNSVRRPEPPVIDDEFAKDLGDFANLEALRARIRSDLLEMRNRAAEAELHRTVMDSLIERTPFEVPHGLVHRQLHRHMESTERQYKGMVPDEVLREQLNRIHNEGRPMAERRVREALLLEAVADRADIEIADSDVDARLDEMARARGVEPSVFRRWAREQEVFEAVRGELRERRALELLASKARVADAAAS